MAIKYPGTNMIGYGKAQVWKDRDITRGAEMEKRKKCPPGYMFDGQKCVPLPKKKDILSDLKDIDISKVRNAELTGDNNLYQQKDDIIAFGVKNMAAIQDKSDGGKAYMEFEKMKSNLQRNIIMSVNQKAKDTEVLKMMTDDENFMTPTNMDMWKQTTSTSMFSENWNQQSEDYSQDEIDSAKSELQNKYYEDDGAGNIVLKPNMSEDDYNSEVAKMEEQIASGKPIAGVGELYNQIEPEFNYNEIIKNAVENLSVDELTRIYDGKTKTSGHDMYTEKQTVANESALNAMNGAFQGHQYGQYIQNRIQKDAEALGMDVNEYLLQQASPHLQTKFGTWYGRKAPVTRINVSTGQTTPASRGSLLEQGSVFDYAGGAFTTTANGVETSITPKTNSKMYFEMTPDREFQGKPTGFQVLQTYKVGNKTLQGGYYQNTTMTEFVPNSIHYYHTAPKDITINGTKYQGGQMINDDDWSAFISGKSKEDIVKLENQYSKPWLKGTQKNGKGEVAYRFNGAAKAQFEQWFVTSTNAKDPYKALEELLAKANIKRNAKNR